MVNEVVTTPTGTAIDTVSGLHYLVPSMTFSEVMELTTANYANRIIFISDMGLHGSLWKCNGIYWAPVHDVTLYTDTEERELVNTVTSNQDFFPGYTIPKGALNPKSRVIIKQAVLMDYTASNKWVRTYFGTAIALQRTRGAVDTGVTPPATVFETSEVEIINRNNYKRQLHPYQKSNFPMNDFGGLHTSNIDTAEAVTIIPKMQFSGGGGQKKATLYRFEIILKA